MALMAAALLVGREEPVALAALRPGAVAVRVAAARVMGRRGLAALRVSRTVLSTAVLVAITLRGRVRVLVVPQERAAQALLAVAVAVPLASRRHLPSLAVRAGREISIPKRPTAPRQAVVVVLAVRVGLATRLA